MKESGWYHHSDLRSQNFLYRQSHRTFRGYYLLFLRKKLIPKFHHTIKSNTHTSKTTLNYHFKKIKNVELEKFPLQLPFVLHCLLTLHIQKTLLFTIFFLNNSSDDFKYIRQWRKKCTWIQLVETTKQREIIYSN